jgi:hypothetical protein
MLWQFERIQLNVDIKKIDKLIKQNATNRTV